MHSQSVTAYTSGKFVRYDMTSEVLIESVSLDILWVISARDVNEEETILGEEPR